MAEPLRIPPFLLERFYVRVKSSVLQLHRSVHPLDQAARVTQSLRASFGPRGQNEIPYKG